MNLSPTLKSIDEAPEDIAKKLINMVALARESTEEGEIANALAFANKLALKHQIDINTIDIEEAGVERSAGSSKEEFISEDFYTAKGVNRRPPAYKYIEDILINFFRVRIIRRGSGSRISFVGRRSDVAFAIYVFGFLHHTFQKRWRKYKKETGALMCERNSFYNGIWISLSAKLRDADIKAKKEIALQLGENKHSEEPKNTNLGLILIKEEELLGQAVKGHHPVVKTVRVDYDTNVDRGGYTFYAGFDAGKDIDINRPIGEKREEEKERSSGSLL